MEPLNDLSTMVGITTTNILLTGASGYLGQHLLDHFLKNPPSSDEDHQTIYRITALYHKSKHFAAAVADYTAASSSSSSGPRNNVQIIPKAGNLIDFTSDHEQQFDVCIHTAALSSPRECENNPETATAINVPKQFLEATKDIPIMIVLSTDQVYDGKQNVVMNPNNEMSTLFYKEDDTTDNSKSGPPLNVYGQTKLQLERTLRGIRNDKESRISSIVLRSSIILGPKAPIDNEAAHDTFLHFCASRGGQGKAKPTELWIDEYRTVVSVDHVCRVILKSMTILLLKTTTPIATDNNDDYQIFNMGGPWRLNRYEMGKAVFDYFGWESNDNNILIPANQTATTVPLDISMDSTKLQQFTGIVHEPATFEELVAAVFSPTIK
eukprot:scaffold2738_cov119-Cylindrotheca_fusiformis.AAC.3